MDNERDYDHSVKIEARKRKRRPLTILKDVDI